MLTFLLIPCFFFFFFSVCIYIRHNGKCLHFSLLACSAFLHPPTLSEVHKASTALCKPCSASSFSNLKAGEGCVSAHQRGRGRFKALPYLRHSRHQVACECHAIPLKTYISAEKQARKSPHKWEKRQTPHSSQQRQREVLAKTPPRTILQPR